MENPIRGGLAYSFLGGSLAFDLFGALGDGDPLFFRVSFYLLTGGIAISMLLSMRQFRSGTVPDRARRWSCAANLGALLSFVVSWVLRLSLPGTPSDAAIATSFAAAAVGLAARWFDGELHRWHRSLPLPFVFTLALLILAVGLYAVTTSVWFNRPERDDSRLTLRGHRGVVLSIALSPDARHIVSGGWDETVRLWQTSTGRAVKVLRGHTDRVMAVAFSPDGRWLVSGSKDATARVWEVGTGRLAHVLTSHGNRVTSLAFSPDGSVLATGSRDRTVKTWTVTSWRELRTFTGHSGFVWSVAFSPDGGTLASGSWDGTIRLWDVNGSTEPRIVHTGARVRSVVFSDDGRWLASSGYDHASISLGGKRLVSRIYNVAAGSQPRIHCSYIDASIFAIRGDSVFCADRDRAIRIRGLPNGMVMRTLLGHSHQVTSLAVNIGGDLLVSASDDGTVKVWQLSP